MSLASLRAKSIGSTRRAAMRQSHSSSVSVGTATSAPHSSQRIQSHPPARVHRGGGKWDGRLASRAREGEGKVSVVEDAVVKVGAVEQLQMAREQARGRLGARAEEEARDRPERPAERLGVEELVVDIREHTEEERVSRRRADEVDVVPQHAVQERRHPRARVLLRADAHADAVRRGLACQFEQHRARGARRASVGVDIEAAEAEEDRIPSKVGARDRLQKPGVHIVERGVLALEPGQQRTLVPEQVADTSQAAPLQHSALSHGGKAAEAARVELVQELWDLPRCRIARAAAWQRRGSCERRAVVRLHKRVVDPTTVRVLPHDAEQWLERVDVRAARCRARDRRRRVCSHDGVTDRPVQIVCDSTREDEGGRTAAAQAHRRGQH
eukprot:scaffold70096_cov75-Phaeocystis_antarctica.AAC.5